MATTAPRSEAEREVLALAAGAAGESLDAVLERIVAALQSRFAHYTGVYIYWLDGDTLVLRSFRGRPTEHVRIPVGAGICGRAAREKQTVTVDDVGADPAYLACSIETRSEIVVPVMRGTRVLGEIDIDSDVPAAFTEADRRFLEQVAFLIATRA
ncbi:MAG TPA: GAF domain-containing protein [Gemmatimonadales bacterium]|nr:GAF domain-containing protein [Gemmatimonadales bacterium]